MSKKIQQAYDRLKAHALSLPEAWEDHPWGESAIKVRKKIFLFMGHGQPEAKDGEPAKLGFGLKLPASAHEVLRHDWAEPSGYGLGRSGWVSISVTAADLPKQSTLDDWVEESYQAVAPKKLARLLDGDE